MKITLDFNFFLTDNLFALIKEKGFLMENFLQEFIDFMHQHGCGPHNTADIKGDNKRRNYTISGGSVNKKQGYYKLDIDGDFAYGYFGDYRVGDHNSWHSRSAKTLSESERRAYKEKVELRRRQEKEEREALHRERAKEAQDNLLFLEEAQKHNYLLKKKIKPCGALINDGVLYIPMRDKEQVWNHQAIDVNGKKRFLKEARVSGAWFVMPGDDTICIVEGYATGASVYMATGHTVYVAFNANNLRYVAAHVAQEHAGQDIILCADNDHETVINGKPYNTGLVKARELLKEFDISMCYPEFKDGSGLSDYNDLHVNEGLEVVWNSIQSALTPHTDAPDSTGGGDPTPNKINATPASVPLQPPSDAWRKQLTVTKSGIDKHSTKNAYLICVNDPALSGVFKYDEFAKETLLYKCPPWIDESAFYVRPVQDHDYVSLDIYIELEWDVRPGKNKCADLIDKVSKSAGNVLNPARDCFLNMQWDGVPRLNTWLADYVSDGMQPEEYLSLVGRKFICGLAARAMEPGVKFDTMIILEGKQYAGKSFLSRVMGTVNGHEYFLDDFKDIDNKDALMKMQGKIVIEFPEVSTLRKSEVNDLKAFITRQEDVFRPPYGRNSIVAPRQCVFVGTVNPEGPYFKDMTGNRRYWPVSCRDKLPMDKIKKVMPQLHAEASHLYQNGERLHLSDSEYDIARIEQDKRCIVDLWFDKVSGALGTRHTITMDEILDTIDIPMERRSPMIFQRIHQIMARLGWRPTKLKIGQTRRSGFKKETPQMELEEIVF